MGWKGLQFLDGGASLLGKSVIRKTHTKRRYRWHTSWCNFATDADVKQEKDH